LIELFELIKGKSQPLWRSTFELIKGKSQPFVAFLVIWVLEAGSSTGLDFNII
jgi:hypothetical protein